MTAPSTNGWDTVFAIKFPDVNSAIVSAGASPASFSYTNTGSSGTIVITGTFGDWQLTTGGDGENLHMSLPISSGSVDNAGSVTPYSNATATIEVRLDLLPQPGATSTSGPNNLVVDPSVVSVLDISYSGTAPDAVTSALINQGLEDWLVANIQDFNHVFATVDLNTRLDSASQFQWLMPTHTSYAVGDAATVADAVFAVLSMTENRSAANLSHIVDADAIPGGERSGFLINTERFLEKIVLPGVPVFFSNASESDFDIVEDGTQIVNNTSLTFQEFTLENGNTVTADIERGNFTVTVEETNLITTFSGLHYSSSPGIDVYVDFTQYSVMELDDEGRIDLRATTFTQGGSVETSVGVQIADIISGVVVEVLAIAIGTAAGSWLEDAAEVEQNVQEGIELEQNTANMGETTGNILPGATDAEIGQAQEGTNAVQTAADEVGNANQPARFNGWLARGNVKMKGAVIGGLAGLFVSTPLSAIVFILEAIADKNREDIPTLLEFAETAVSPVTWPNASQYTLTSATLNGCLQIGGDPGFSQAG